MLNTEKSRVPKLVKQPLFWCWLFVIIWLGHVLVTLVMQRWTGLTISLFGLLAALLVVGAIHSCRRRNLFPKAKSTEPSA
jgi:hypothetical protein